MRYQRAQPPVEGEVIDGLIWLPGSKFAKHKLLWTHFKRSTEQPLAPLLTTLTLHLTSTHASFILYPWCPVPVLRLCPLVHRVGLPALLNRDGYRSRTLQWQCEEWVY